MSLFRLFLIFGLVGCGTVSIPRVDTTPTRKPFTFSNTVLSLTFDDGDADNYDVRQVLKEKHIHATFYIISGFVGTDGYMTEDQLRGLFEDGNEIGGHTRDHTKLTEVRGGDLQYQVCQNRQDLVALGFDPISFAYPYGQYDDVAKQAVKDCGFMSARLVTHGPEVIPPQDMYALRAMPYIVRDTRVDKMQRYVKGVEEEGGGWAIFTFHHVCNQCDEYSITLEDFTQFAQWAYHQQTNGLIIKTIGEVIQGAGTNSSRP